MMDIRKFFSPKGSKTSSKQRSPMKSDGDDFGHKKARKNKSKGIIFDSDSDGEDPLPKKTRKKIDLMDVIPKSDDEFDAGTKKKSSNHGKTAKPGTSRNKRKQEPQPARKEITPDSFFGACKPAVQKRHRLTKRKASDGAVEEKVKAETSEVILIDDDLDFDGSLSMTPKKKAKREHKVDTGEKTLAGKLSSMVEKRNIKEKPEGKQRSGSVTENSGGHSNKRSAAREREHKVEKVDDFKEKSVKSSYTVEKSKSKQRENFTPKKKEPDSVSKPSTKAPSVSKSSKEAPSSTPKKVSPEKARRTSEDKDTTGEGSSKKDRFIKYKQWQNRSGPKAPGSKEIPQGEENCLEGLTFVITGILESLERDEAKTLIERYGGKVTGSISGRTAYILIGDDPGESKVQKAEHHKTKKLDEDGLLELIRTKPGRKSKYEIAAEKEIKNEVKSVLKASQRKSSADERQETMKPTVHNGSKNKLASPTTSFYGAKKKEVICSKSASAGDSQDSLASLPDSQKLTPSSQPDAEFLLWVDKYKPKTLKQIIGQQGAKSNVEKLRKWMLDWHANNRPKDGSKPKPKPKVNPWGGGGDPTGAGFKAALLSGPPGVGKTTAATLVCKELGFEYIELNASDTRSKKTLHEVTSQMTDNTSISNMFGTKDMQKTAASGTRNALIMDEIDGMAGNEDRGGMQEVIQLIKTSKIPIICMCNDRTSPKMRSLTNHCFDLRFQRPRVEQITGAMMSICYKEGLKISAPALQALIRGCNQDVRQILYNLSMLRASSTSVSYDEAHKHADGAHKDVSIGIFDIARKLLTSESASLSMNEKLSLFFMDYSIIPLFVQDNYPHIRPASAGGNIHKHLAALSKSADSIALGDQLDRLLRSDQAWSALPTVGLLTTVVPCDIMRGGMSGMINFPSFFGKLSTTGKNRRLLQELKFHSSLATGGADEDTFNLDYLPYLRWHLTQPLITQSETGESELHKSSSLLSAYDLLREDFDSLVEIGQYPGKTQPMSQVDTKVKSAFTRTFNKESHKTPYAVQSVKKSRKATVSAEEAGYGLEGEEASQALEEDDKEEEVDAMIKAKPVKKKPAPSGAKRKKSESTKKRKK